MNREQHRRENQAIQKRYETKYFPLVAGSIQSVIDDVKNVVDKRGVQAGVTYLNREIQNTEVTRTVQKLALEVGLRFARRTWTGLQEQKRNTKGYSFEQKGFGFNAQWVEWIKRYLFSFIVETITFSVFETTKDTLFRVLNEAIAGGWGVKETVKELEELQLSKTQAARIVRTEITRAANAGAMAAGETFPFEQSKEWIAAHDSRTRGQKEGDHASHIGLDGRIVDYDDVFVDPINGDRLRFPGDPEATAASTCNCRCSVAVVAKIGMNGRLIPKRNQIAA